MRGIRSTKPHRRFVRLNVEGTHSGFRPRIFQTEMIRLRANSQTCRTIGTMGCNANERKAAAHVRRSEVRRSEHQ